MLRCAARTAFNEILPNGVIVEKLLRVDTSATVTGPRPAGECYRAGELSFFWDFPAPPAWSFHTTGHISLFRTFGLQESVLGIATGRSRTWERLVGPY